MKMAIGPLRIGAVAIGVLYQATIVSERPRPPLHYLEPSDALAQYKADDAPILTSCNICAKLKFPSNGEWVDPDVYYQRGGKSKVRLSHGLCPPCAATLHALSEMDEAA